MLISQQLILSGTPTVAMTSMYNGRVRLGYLSNQPRLHGELACQ